jgi:hypothetical protein
LVHCSLPLHTGLQAVFFISFCLMSPPPPPPKTLLSRLFRTCIPCICKIPVTHEWHTLISLDRILFVIN